MSSAISTCLPYRILVSLDVGRFDQMISRRSFSHKSNSCYIVIIVIDTDGRRRDARIRSNTVVVERLDRYK